MSSRSIVASSFGSGTYILMGDTINNHHGTTGTPTTSSVRFSPEISEPPAGLMLCDLPTKTEPFFGRERELSQMRDQLQTSASNQTWTVLCGISGSGKTQLALQYIEQERAKFSAILWVDASSDTATDESFGSIASRICQEFPPSEKKGTARFLVLEWLKTTRFSNWLFVVDSMDDMIRNKHLVDQLRLLRSGTICITSSQERTPEALGITPILMDRLDPAASQSLLLWKALDTENDPGYASKANFYLVVHRINTLQARESARKAAAFLGDFPLAIELAGFLVNVGILPMNALYQSLTTQYPRFVQYQVSPGFWLWEKSNSLSSLFETVLKSIAAKDKSVCDLLALCSVYGRWEIPLALLRKLTINYSDSLLVAGDLGPELKPLVKDDAQLNMVIDDMNRAFLIKKKQDAQRQLLSISLHDSISRWCFETIDDKAMSVMEASYLLALYIQQIFSSKAKARELYDIARSLFSPVNHCMELVTKHVASEDLRMPGGKYATKYFFICSTMAPIHVMLGKYSVSKDMFASALEYTQTKGNVEWAEEEVLGLTHGLAISYERTGGYAEAEQCFSTALELSERIYGHMSDEAVNINHSLKSVKGRISRELNHRKTALIATTGSKLLTDPTSRHDIIDETTENPPSNHSHSTTRYVEAEALHRQKLQLQETVLGKEHQDTLTSRSNLAESLYYQHKYAEAEAMYQQTLQLQETVLGKEHQDTLSSRSNLATSLCSQHKYTEAEAMYRQTLQLREMVLGKEHPDTLRSRSGLAISLYCQDKHAEAEAMYRQILQLRETVLGKEHLDTLMSMSSLATSLYGQHKYAEAEAMYRQTLQLRETYAEAEAMYQQTLQLQETVLGKEHLDTLTSRSSLADSLYCQDKHAEAEVMYLQTLQLQETVLGKEHLDTLRSRSSLADSLYCQDKHAEAEVMYLQTLQLRETVLGKEHLDTLRSRSGLADSLYYQDKHAEAEAMYRQTLQLRETALGKEHPDTLTSMNSLANSLFGQDKHAEAEVMYLQTLQLRETVLGKEHPDTLTSRNNLADSLCSQYKSAEAEAMYRQTLQLRETVLGKEHPDTLTSMSGLANSLYYEFKYDEAEAMYRQTLQLREMVLGKEHPDTLQSRNDLANVSTENS
ncbi:hypothetical protein BP6252_07224 [Coleophoma cylindrospora]|uniref:NB-ARC domain-containing protein n=1 Tax=Coleophoma cylindrospora TaxID=1849047 RepID=A0A3D8RH15_9HELO|nr:hypothetical protein BP6252_07224 [Coleophoma cylindrospora]